MYIYRERKERCKTCDVGFFFLCVDRLVVEDVEITSRRIEPDID